MPTDSLPSRSLARRALQWLAIGVAGVVLTGFFVYMGFPYGRLAENLGREIEGGANLQIRYGEIGPQIHWLGPGVAATDFSVISDGVESVRLDELSLRPAWSLSWFRGVPSISVAATADAARGSFEVTLDDPLRLRGGVRDSAVAITM